MSDKNAVELYRAHRPSSLDDLVGQDEIVDSLESMLTNNRLPHCLLASGPSGTGKTTTFRILRDALDCSPLDFKEVNAAESRGIEMVREIKSHLGLSPIKGKSKIWLIDEAHQLTSAAQEAFLKMLEDTPSHVYFFLASTDPQKLKKTIITRCTHLKFKTIADRDIIGLLDEVCEAETNKQLPESISNTIAKLADGSARKALVLLHPIVGMDFTDEEGILELLEKADTKRQAHEIARGLMQKSLKWKDMAEILKNVDEDPESIRWMVLSWMTKVALSGKPGISDRACLIISEFESNFYDSKKAGLVRACYAVVCGV